MQNAAGTKFLSFENCNEKDPKNDRVAVKCTDEKQKSQKFYLEILCGLIPKFFRSQAVILCSTFCRKASQTRMNICL